MRAGRSKEVEVAVGLAKIVSTATIVWDDGAVRDRLLYMDFEGVPDSEDYMVSLFSTARDGSGLREHDIRVSVFNNAIMVRYRPHPFAEYHLVLLPACTPSGTPGLYALEIDSERVSTSLYELLGVTTEAFEAAGVPRKP